MQWSEVRRLFPDQFILAEELASHIEGDKIIVDEMAILRPVPKEEATQTLLQCKDKMFVYHTSHDSVEIAIRRRPGLRGRLHAN